MMEPEPISPALLAITKKTTMPQRTDETRQCLLNWIYDSTQSELLAGQVLLDQGYENFDPAQPRGGPDGGKDALCSKDGIRWIMAVHFPREQKNFSATKTKFKLDLPGVAKNGAAGIVFVTNQKISVTERETLKRLAGQIAVDIYHLDRLESILIQPRMEKVRQHFLFIDPHQSGTAAEETTTVQEPKKSGWVWHCTAESIAAEQVSVIAIGEIIIAVPLYWWLVSLSPWPWMAFIGMFAAPLLLLRSEASITRGVELLRGYWDLKTEVASKNGMRLIIATCVLVTGLLTYWVASNWLPGYAGWASYWRSVVLGMGAGAVAIAFAGVGWGAGADKDAGTVAGASAFACLAIIIEFVGMAGMAGAIHGAIVVGFSGMFARAGEGLFLGTSERTGTKIAIANAIAGVGAGGVAAGILVRGFFIRLYATLMHFPAGFAQLPQNWHETILSTDPWHMPELLPQAGTVSEDFSVQGLWANRHARRRADKIILYIFLAVFYISAIAYRWSLKASAWLWFPLILALRPPLHRKSESQSRISVAITVGWHYRIGILALVVMGWIFLTSPIKGVFKALFSEPQLDFIIDALPLPPPLLSLRVALACIGFALTLILMFDSTNIKSAHGKPLEVGKDFEGMPKDDKTDFMARAKRIDRIKLLLIGIVIAWGYSMIGAWALQQNPNWKVNIWHWLLAIL
jgi:hypothetical protein